MYKALLTGLWGVGKPAYTPGPVLWDAGTFFSLYLDGITTLEGACLSASDTMGLQPQDWFLEATPGAYQEAQKKGVAAGKCSVPSGSLEEGDRLLLGQEGRSGRVSPGCSGSPCQEAGSDEGEEVRRSVHPGRTGYSMQYVGITGTPLWQYSLQEARVGVKHCQPLWTSWGWG